MRGSTSSTDSAPAIRSEKSASTSYGLARWPYTSRFASRWSRSRAGWKMTATSAVATSDRTRLASLLVWASVPTPATTPTYVMVMHAPSPP